MIILLAFRLILSNVHLFIVEIASGFDGIKPFYGRRDFNDLLINRIGFFWLYFFVLSNELLQSLFSFLLGLFAHQRLLCCLNQFLEIIFLGQDFSSKSNIIPISKLP